MELNLKLPEIYYVQLDDIKLYDQEGNIVSYDYRDVGYKVKSILFIPKEYVIYINVDLFQNEMNMLVNVIRLLDKCIIQYRYIISFNLKN